MLPFCRVLRLSDCAVSADCLASVGSACPSLEELRYRTASASYSPERVTARSELVYNTHIMRIVQGAACTLSACALVISAMRCRVSHALVASALSRTDLACAWEAPAY